MKLQSQITFLNLQSQEEFEDTKGVIRICKSKNRKHNGQKKKDRKKNNNLQNITIEIDLFSVKVER
jgi:hypothetical protein